MREQNRKIRDLDDRPKSKEEIAKIIERMLKTDENGEPEGAAKKETA